MERKEHTDGEQARLEALTARVEALEAENKRLKESKTKAPEGGKVLTKEQWETMQKLLGELKGYRAREKEQNKTIEDLKGQLEEQDGNGISEGRRELGRSPVYNNNNNMGDSQEQGTLARLGMFAANNPGKVLVGVAGLLVLAFAMGAGAQDIVAGIFAEATGNSTANNSTSP